jgi:hypothetical protein
MLKKKIAVAKSFRLFYFDVLNDVLEHPASSSDDEKEKEKKKKGDEKQFLVQMYGINEKGETCSIIVDDFEPFFYIKVGDNWDLSKVNTMVREIKSAIGDFYKDSITHFELVDSQKLYGFSAGKKSKFVKLVFKNTVVFNKSRKTFYTLYAVIRGKFATPFAVLPFDQDFPQWLGHGFHPGATGAH